MRPQTVLKNGKTEASAILFAHNGKEAKKMLIEWHKGEEEKRQSDNLSEKHQDFIDFVLKDWAAEIATEAAVTLEFID